MFDLIFKIIGQRRSTEVSSMKSQYFKITQFLLLIELEISTTKELIFRLEIKEVLNHIFRSNQILQQ
jgi:hypothetical protein